MDCGATRAFRRCGSKSSSRIDFVERIRTAICRPPKFCSYSKPRSTVSNTSNLAASAAQEIAVLGLLSRHQTALWLKHYSGVSVKNLSGNFVTRCKETPDCANAAYNLVCCSRILRKGPSVECAATLSRCIPSHARFGHSTTKENVQ